MGKNRSEIALRYRSKCPLLQCAGHQSPHNGLDPLYPIQMRILNEVG